MPGRRCGQPDAIVIAELVGRTGRASPREIGHPKFVQLVARRGRLAWWLAGIVFVLFYALVLTVAFAPAVIGLRVMEGSTLTVGVAAGLFEFVFFWLLTSGPRPASARPRPRCIEAGERVQHKCFASERAPTSLRQSAG